MRKYPLMIVAVAMLATAVGCEDDCAVDDRCDGQLATVEGVVDGDTIRVYELSASVRLMGVNTPETHGTNSGACPGSEWDNMTPENQATYSDDCCYGVQAKEMLLDLIPPGTFVCLKNPTGGELEMGRYDRYLADVYVGETYVNLKMIVGGYARTYTGEFAHPTMAEEFSTLAAEAETNGAGLWGYCQSAEAIDPCEEPAE